MKKFIIILLSLLISSSGFAGTTIIKKKAAVSETPFVSQLLSNGGIPAGVTSSQSFTMVGTTISKVKVWFYGASGQSISIRVSSNKWGEEIATVSGLTASTDANGVAANFTLTGLTSGVVYWVHILDSTGTVSLSRQSGGSVYSGGVYYFNSDPTSWATTGDNGLIDLKFEVYP